MESMEHSSGIALFNLERLRLQEKKVQQMVAFHDTNV